MRSNIHRFQPNRGQFVRYINKQVSLSIVNNGRQVETITNINDQLFLERKRRKLIIGLHARRKQINER